MINDLRMNLFVAETVALQSPRDASEPREPKTVSLEKRKWEFDL